MLGRTDLHTAMLVMGVVCNCLTIGVYAAPLGTLVSVSEAPNQNCSSEQNPCMSCGVQCNAMSLRRSTSFFFLCVCVAWMLSIATVAWQVKCRTSTGVCTNSPSSPLPSVTEKLYMHARRVPRGGSGGSIEPPNNCAVTSQKRLRRQLASTSAALRFGGLASANAVHTNTAQKNAACTCRLQ